MRIPQTSPKRARNLAGSLRRILLAKLGIRIGRGRSTEIMARAFGYKDMHELEVVSNASGGRRPRTTVSFRKARPHAGASST